MPALDAVEERSRDALDALVSALRLTDDEVAERTGMKRQGVQSRRTGGTRIRPGEHRVFAKAFGVEERVFTMTRPEVFRYLAEHPDLLERINMCFPMSAGSPRLAHAS